MKKRIRQEKGMTLLEIIISLALLGIISVTFLAGAQTSAKARFQADERASAKVLAENIIDSVKKMDYSSSYTAAIPDDYPGYSAEVTAAYLDGNALQKITVTITHGGREILTLENYKVDR
jgi:prepilin-type N-terminal cleavage/methylation domain-containing protein